ncbi:MAG TPA: PilW family protein [Burkholderiales bacterium]
MIPMRKAGGFSLIELMIAMTLGLVLLAVLATVFSSSSESQRALQRNAAQIESGRFAMDMLTQDLHVAGYYGQMGIQPNTATLPDPCLVTTAAQIKAAMTAPVQLYRAVDLVSIPDTSATTCGTWLNNSNVKPGSDILVIRRAETSVVAIGQTALSNEVYLQATSGDYEIQFGNGSALLALKKADGNDTVLRKLDNTAAEIRKYRTHIYFVARCSVPGGGGDVCGAANDDGGTRIPTLKRLELTVSGTTRTFVVTPIAEGVDYFKVDVGLDTSPPAVNAATNSIGDGAPDSYTNAPSAADHANIVTAKIHMVVRNPEPSAGFLDDKTYALGLIGSVGPIGDRYKRHGYVSEIRLTNLSARREIP